MLQCVLHFMFFLTKDLFWFIIIRNWFGKFTESLKSFFWAHLLIILFTANWISETGADNNMAPNVCSHVGRHIFYGKNAAVYGVFVSYVNFVQRFSILNVYFATKKLWWSLDSTDPSKIKSNYSRTRKTKGTKNYLT